ncbi:MAG: DegT/DnrJ/EryC1/StrS family aminotransferase, partial [Dehalococcoidia bacterium]|nr:DegT/DnrJ/EryC1/StrS family aminotransferase [Dehalococcoidia bacterium]
HGRVENSDYFSSAERMDYVVLGFNYRLSNITAALGLAQINKVDEIIEMRRSKAKYMTSKLRDIREVITPNTLNGYFHVYQLYSIRVNAKLRDKLSKHLAEAGIMTKVYFHPVHKTSFYRHKLKYNSKLSITEKISLEILSLPIYPHITNKEVTYICEKINSFLQDV